MKIGETEKEKAAKEKAAMARIKTVSVKVDESPGFKQGWIDMVSFEVDTDLVKISDGVRMQQLIGVDSEKTFSALVNAGSLLQIALTKAGNEPCSTSILEVIKNYQFTMADCEVKTKGFTMAALSSLQCHKNALEVLSYATKPSEYAKALALLEICVTTAENMVTVSTEMVASAETAPECRGCPGSSPGRCRGQQKAKRRTQG